MNTISKVRNSVTEFLKENNNTTDVTVIKILKSADIWKAVAEVYEDDSFLKSMNLPPKKVRLYYSVTVDSECQVLSFSRMTTYDDSDDEQG